MRLRHMHDPFIFIISTEEGSPVLMLNPSFSNSWRLFRAASEYIPQLPFGGHTDSGQQESELGAS